MIAGPPRFDSGTPSAYQKVEVVMLPVTPALEVHSVNQSTMSIPADCLSVYLPPPTSPKTHELRTRSEVTHAKWNDLKLEVAPFAWTEDNIS